MLCILCSGHARESLEKKVVLLCECICGGVMLCEHNSTCIIIQGSNINPWLFGIYALWQTSDQLRVGAVPS